MALKVEGSTPKDLSIDVAPAANETEFSEVKVFYDNKDTRLAIANVAHLIILQASRRSPELAAALILPAIISNTWRLVKVYRTTPDAATVTKSLAHPLFQLLVPGVLNLIHPLLAKACIAAQFVGVAQNAAPKLYTCLTNRKEKPGEALAGSALHIFNLASVGYISKATCDALDAMNKAFKGVFAEPAACPGKPASAFEGKTNLERLSDPDLKPKTCLADAVTILNVKPDLKCELTIQRYPFEASAERVHNAVKEACASTCKAIAGAFRRLSAGAHPDKKGPENAFYNLVDARDKLDGVYGCKSLAFTDPYSSQDVAVQG